MPKLTALTTRIFLAFFTLLLFLQIFTSNAPIAPIARAQETGIEDDETAATNPKDREINLNALVPEQSDPTTPILISPPDNSISSDNKLSFVWKESTDVVPISYYELKLDGESLFGNLPTTDTETDDYILKYYPDTGYYSVTPKDGLSDGTYTWQVRVVSSSGKGALSVIWTFTLDTQSPAFVITQIDEQSVAISAQDLESVPEEPIELENNSPYLRGTGEPNSTVVLTINIPGETSQTVTFPIDGDGNWVHQLGILPRDVIIDLDFVITDTAGLVSVLNNVPLILRSTPGIVIPIIPGLPTLPPQIIPPGIVVQPLDLIDIPDFIRDVTSPVVERVVEGLPEPLRAYFRTTPILQRFGLFELLISLSAVLLIISPPLISFLLLSTLFGGTLTIQAAKRVLQIIGLWPKKPGGIVIESEHQWPVGYALVTFSGKDEDGTHVNETVLTDENGIYPYFTLPHGEYEAHIRHRYHSFPSKQQRDPIHRWQDYYLGESLAISDAQENQHLIIPVDLLKQYAELLTAQTGNQIHARLQPKRVRLVQRLRFAGGTSLGLFVAAVLITFFFPTLPNLAAITLYIIGLTKRSWKQAKPKLSGELMSKQRNPIDYGVLRVLQENEKTSDDKTSQYHTIDFTQTKRDGTFSVPDSQNVDALIVVENGWRLSASAPLTTSPTTVVLQSQKVPVVLTMQRD